MDAPIPVPFVPANQRAGSAANLAKPVPFKWKPAALIPPRAWLYGGHFQRKQLGVTVASAGVGKSSLMIVEAISMVTGRPLLGVPVERPLKVWIYNLEDPMDEMYRRISAAIQHYRIDPEEVEGRLYLNSGREVNLCVAIQSGQNVQIDEAAFNNLKAWIVEHEIDVLIVDPFVSSHQVSENDNGAIDKVAKAWASLANDSNCAVELVHHTRKTNSVSSTSEDARGANALIGAARSARVLNVVDRSKHADQGVCFQVTRDKANFAPSGETGFRRLVSVQLPNGDNVGVVESYDPKSKKVLSDPELRSVLGTLAGKSWREDPQAADWGGKVIASALGLDPQKDKASLKRVIADLVAEGVLVKSAIYDPNDRRKRPVFTVSDRAVQQYCTTPETVVEQGGAV